MDVELRIRFNPDSGEIELVSDGTVLGTVDKDTVGHWMNVVAEKTSAKEK